MGEGLVFGWRTAFSAYPGKAPKLNPGTYTPDFIFDRVTYGFGKMPPGAPMLELGATKFGPMAIDTCAEWLWSGEASLCKIGQRGGRLSWGLPLTSDCSACSRTSS